MNELHALQNLFRAVVKVHETTIFDPKRAERVEMLVSWIKTAEPLVKYPKANPINQKKVAFTKHREFYEAAKNIVAEHEVITATLLKKKLHIGPNTSEEVAEALQHDGLVSAPDNRGRRICRRKRRGNSRN